MNVDTYEHEMIGKAINYSALPALPVSQARELPIRIIERIRANQQRHAGHIRTQITIKEKMPRDNPEETREQSHACWRHVHLCEKPCETKSDWPVEIKIENSFGFARLISGFEGRNRLDLLRYHTQTRSKLRRAATLLEQVCPREC